MRKANATGVIVVGALLLGASSGTAQDWPQWRGPNRDAKVTGFTAPPTWPKELSQKWKVTVGNGVATPALVGEKLYVFAREGSHEVLRCLNAADGKEIWQEKYEAPAVTGPAGSFPGPRGSPTVADGKVVTLGVGAALCCFDAATGKLAWRKDDFKGTLPRFSPSCSPIVVDGLCIVQLGGENKGAIVAYELANGNEKWKWDRDGTAYASPVQLAAGDAKVIVAETAGKIVGIGVADGKLLWETPFAVSGKGRGYNAATPMVDGQTVIYTGSGRGTKAVQLEKMGDKLVAKELWNNSEQSVQFNTPVLKDGLVFGISERDNLFCINKEGKTAWSTALTAGGRNRGYGSVVDAGPVLFALNPSGQLIVFEPTEKEYKEIAKYKVADTETFAYPIVAGKRVFVKDKDSVILWMIE